METKYLNRIFVVERGNYSDLGGPDDDGSYNRVDPTPHNSAAGQLMETAPTGWRCGTIIKRVKNRFRRCREWVTERLVFRLSSENGNLWRYCQLR